MGAIAAMWMLVARSAQRVERPAEVELEPIEPGAWAREFEGPAPRLTHPAPRNARVSAGRFEVNAGRLPGRVWAPLAAVTDSAPNLLAAALIARLNG